MPVHHRVQIAMAADTTLPRDRVVITPCFRHNGPVVDMQGFCSSLATAMATWMGAFGTGTREIRVKSYDVEGTPPVYPDGDATANAGLVPATALPREVALCLSFYGDRNIPRRRGRLYIPAFVVASSVNSLRPLLATRQRVADLVPVLAGAGGSDVDWIVWSKTERVAHKVTNWWVDDEWDIQRRRGLRSTTRDTGTTTG